MQLGAREEDGGGTRGGDGDGERAAEQGMCHKMCVQEELNCSTVGCVLHFQQGGKI